MLSASHESPERHYFLCPTDSPEPKDSSSTVISDEEKQQIFTFKKLETEYIRNFCLKKETINPLSKQLATNFLLIVLPFSRWWIVYD